MEKSEFDELVHEYNKVNNSFSDICIYHVGCSAGFHSEVDAMMQCMLYCYMNKIKFVLYGDDANFSSCGYDEFFVPFCEMNHSKLNHKYNDRYSFYHGKVYNLFNFILRKKEKAKYLTADVFSKCIPRQYSTNTYVKWDLFGINGTNFDEFGKLSKITLFYNDKTKKEVEEIIKSLNLPADYCSVQFRGGDKIKEHKELNKTINVVNRIKMSGILSDNIFVFSDDYSYIEEFRDLMPTTNIYTLTTPSERGYNNDAFNLVTGVEKHNRMIRLFAMIDICLNSKVHFGNETTCVNNFIRSVKDSNSYYCICNETPRNR